MTVGETWQSKIGVVFWCGSATPPPRDATGADPPGPDTIDFLCSLGNANLPVVAAAGGSCLGCTLPLWLGPTRPTHCSLVPWSVAIHPRIVLAHLSPQPPYVYLVACPCADVRGKDHPAVHPASIEGCYLILSDPSS